MKYMGSKNRLAKYILPTMLAKRYAGQTWVEPFVGGANIIDKVYGERIGYDIDEHAINALITIRDSVNSLSKNNAEFTELDYSNLRDCRYIYMSYAGFAFSYGAKWLGGWRRDKEGCRDYVKEAYKNALKQSPNLQGVKFIRSIYQDLEIPTNSIVYCDPPYANTTKYKNEIDYKYFWQWCRDKSEEGHTVFVSEYAAPDDFECVWEKEFTSSLTRDTGSKMAVERLFKYRY